MSIELIAWAYKQTVGDPSAKSTLVALCNYADEDGIAYPSQRRLSEITELSVRTLQRALQRLEEQGFIERSERRRKDGYKSSDEFLILRDRLSGDVMSHDKLSCDKSVDSQATQCQDKDTSYEVSEPSVNPSGAASPLQASKPPRRVRGERLEVFMAREFASSAESCPQEWGEAAVADAKRLRPSTKTDFTKQINWHFEKFYNHFVSSTKQNAVKTDWRRAWLNWWKTEFERIAKQEERDEFYAQKRSGQG